MFRLQDASLHPPEWKEEGGEIPWVLLDRQAYVAERHNATTAFSETWRGERLQVTLCLDRPPRVSYLCVFCPGLPHTVFSLEPDIMAMEEDLILLRIIVSSQCDADIFEDADYYMYQATDEAEGGRPSLKRLPRLPKLPSDQVGILRLRCGARHQRRSNAAGDFYVVAALLSSVTAGEFIICLYNSNSPTFWVTHKISVDENQRNGCHFQHDNSKVISIGGDSGTMGFVDLWRGILLCDVLKLERGKTTPPPPIRYVTLPPPILPGRVNRGDARLARDIAIVQQGRTIKYVELQLHWKPHPTFRGCYFRDGWTSRIWTRPVDDADCAQDSWEPGCKQESSDIPIDSNPHFKLLPEMLDHSGMTVKPFKGLFVCQPTLSLHDDDDLVYFMTKAKSMDSKAWVVAVDMKNNTLQGVDEFVAERTIGVDFSYMHSRISKYLTAAPGTKGNLKRPGTMLLGPSNKKPPGPGFWMCMPPWDDEQKLHDNEMDVDGDDMILT